ncbi:MAG: HAMP domain-containing sensor histidine kinase, partial [Planctomycetota bacterium]|nr:HAMP domain-containing sensor histidine kinase [Planctomycetota bacterium]
QILLPFAGVVLLAVAGTTVVAAFLAARQQERQTLTQLHQLVETLGQASFPVNKTILETMRGLSGAHFVATDAQDRLVATTVGTDLSHLTQSAAASNSEISELPRLPAIVVAGNRYFVVRLDRPAAGEARFLYVLYPESRWTRARWEAALFPLSVGGAAMLLTLGVAAWLGQRFGKRLRLLEGQASAIAGGDFREFPVQLRDDELRDVELAVNRMADRLRAMQSTIRQAEREQLLTQLAGGLAHSLRNAATGARLALQLHSRRCATGANDQSIDVALRQLALLETQVRGLLSLGRAESRPASKVLVDLLLADVGSLVSPACEHAGTQFDHNPHVDHIAVTCDEAALKSAILNLTLNAIEAAGPRGRVVLQATQANDRVSIEISDDGKGPSGEIANTLFEPFVSTKPEGAGLGLALVRQVARDHGGELVWERDNGWTRFRLTLPASQPDASSNLSNSPAGAAP